MRKRSLLLILSVVAACHVAQSYSSEGAAFQKEKNQMPVYEGKVNAPDFPAGVEWLNTDRPLSLRELRGKVVLLDFWTYCCINCMHVIPDLKKLERKYADELVVIGVHSAKFEGERETDNIRQAILRYEIEHAVVNDKDMAVWQQYAVRAWPTLIVIDPAGKVIGYASGEGIYEPFDKLIGKIVETFDAKGQLDRLQDKREHLRGYKHQPMACGEDDARFRTSRRMSYSPHELLVPEFLVARG